MQNGYSADTSKMKTWQKVLAFFPFMWVKYFSYIQKAGTAWERPGWMDKEDVLTHWDNDSSFGDGFTKLNFEANEIVSLTQDLGGYQWKFRKKGFTKELHHKFVRESFIINNQKKYGKVQVGFYFFLRFFIRSNKLDRWNPFPLGKSCTEIDADIEERELKYGYGTALTSEEGKVYRDDLELLQKKNFNNYNSLQYLIYKLENKTDELILSPIKYREIVRKVYGK